MCSTGSYNQTNMFISLDHSIGFFKMNNMMILVLLTVHVDIVLHIAKLILA